MWFGSACDFWGYLPTLEVDGNDLKKLWGMLLKHATQVENVVIEYKYFYSFGNRKIERREEREGKKLIESKHAELQTSRSSLVCKSHVLWCKF